MDESEDPELRCERDFWNYLRLDIPETIERRDQLNNVFNSLFPRGHRDNLREFIANMEIGVRNNLFAGKYGGFFKAVEKIHPDAFPLLERYGVEYTPIRWNHPPRTKEPEWKEC